MDVIGGDKREGLGRKAPPQFLLTLLAFVSGILLFSSLYGAEASVFKKAREQVLDAAAPVLSVFAGPIAVVNDVAGQVSDYFRALEENKALREENAELRLWMREALELRRTLRAYEGLKIYNAPPEARPINAFVIGEANDALTRSMIVNAGRVRGVRSDLAVVDEKGLIGRTVEVGADAARVLLLTDGRSRVPVVIEGADTQGLLVGRADGRPVIDITATGEVDAIAPGQRVVTSGAGGAMPPGLPIGEIAAVTSASASVRLFANPGRARMVRVIDYAFPGLDDAVVDDPFAPVDDPDAAAGTAAPDAISSGAISSGAVSSGVPSARERVAAANGG